MLRLLLALCMLVAHVRSVPTVSPTAQRPTCDTEACKRAGRALHESINYTANPCDDFFEFACGEWVAKHLIPDDKGDIGTFGILTDSMRAKVKSLFDDSSNNKEGQALSVKYAMEQYQQCLDQDSREKLGIGLLKQLLSQLVGGWPILKTSDAKTGGDWSDSFLDTLVTTSLSTLLSITVTPDAKKTTIRRITFDAPDFGLGRKEHADHEGNKEVVDAYKTLMLQIAKPFAGATVDEKLIKEKLEEIFAFEEELALASTPAEDRRDAAAWYNLMTLKDLNALTNNTMNWTGLVNRLYKQLNLPIAVDDKTLVVVSDIPYFKKISQILHDPAKLALIQNYIGWYVAHSLGSFTNNAMAEAFFKYSQAAEGVKKDMPQWRRCYMQVNVDLSMAISRLYVEKFVPAGTLEKVTAMIKDIQGAFHEILLQSDWLDETTRTRAVDKLQHSILNVVYPQWITNNAELDKYHYIKNESVRPSNYLSSTIQIKALGMTKQFAELNEPVNFTLNWPMPPAIVNAAYEPVQNSITIPAGILGYPFYEADNPVMLNYGALGSVIGHEFTHGFDDQGREFDGEGNLNPWWTNQTVKAFESRAQCIIDQYSAIIDPTVHMHLNGKNTQGENIADNGGIHESFLAYENYVKKNGQEPLLPYMEQFSSEQLFYLSYASVWCGSKRPETLKKQINYDPHSPYRYRVNVPLSNAPTFTQAFNCPVGSRMNIKDRCPTW